MSNNVTIFTADQLSNEDYHAETDHISGTSLWKILSTCLAKYRHESKEGKKTKPLVFGTTAHAMMLEPSRFDAEFYRMPSKDEFDSKLLITAVTGLQGWMKERGVDGRSSTDPFKLISIIKQVCDASGEALPLFWHEIEHNAKSDAGTRIQVPGVDFDKCVRMRSVLLANQQFSDVINSGTPELSVFGEFDGVRVKCRFDRVTNDAEIWDYKTTDSAEPEKFKRKAFDLGYPMKMALQYHLFKQAYGMRPKSVNLLAQENKEEPFLPCLFPLTRKTLLIGTAQLRQAISMYKFAKENDIWPSYNGGNPVELDPPYYIEREYQHLWADAETKK